MLDAAMEGELHADLLVIGAVAAITLVTTLGASVHPAIRSARHDLAAKLRD